MTQHTPGPWKAELMGSEGWSVYTTRFLTAEKRFSHTLVLASNLSGDDARLIAAAPELLRAARAVLVAIESGAPDDAERKERAIENSNPLTMSTLRAAIAKATERTGPPALPGEQIWDKVIGH